jgi:uncharacterized protein
VNTQLQPISITERLEVLDVLRGLAICGILIGNMQWFSGYGMAPKEIVAAAPDLDKAVSFVVHWLIEGKFYSIFSFLFGFGFALQIARAEERGDTNATLFKRRLFWLLVIGVLHAYLLWAGDILSIYAFVGFVLLLFRKKSDRSLIKWAIGLMIVPVVWYTILFLLFISFAPPDVQQQIDAGQAEFFRNGVHQVQQGSYFQIVTGFNLNYVVGRYMGLIFDMRLPKILAMFLLGVWAYRNQAFSNKALVRNFLIYALPFGLVVNFVFAYVSGKESLMPPQAIGILGSILYTIGVPTLALGIAALVATIYESPAGRSVASILAPVGRMALTNYLLQTIVCVTIFYGYGLGYYAKIGPATVTMIALIIFATQIVFSTLWLRFFQYGPMEWIWRQLTYKRRLPIKTPKPA